MKSKNKIQPRSLRRIAHFLRKELVEQGDLEEDSLRLAVKGHGHSREVSHRLLSTGKVCLLITVELLNLWANFR